MTFRELEKDLNEFLTKKQELNAEHATETAELRERHKGSYLERWLASAEKHYADQVNPLRSKMEATIEALRAEKLQLATDAATKAPTSDMMTLLQVLSMRKSAIPKTEIIAIAESLKTNYNALAVLADLARDKGFCIDVQSVEQVKARINSACDLAIAAINGRVVIRVEEMIDAYNAAEQRRDALAMVALNNRIHELKHGGVTPWASATQGLDDGYAHTPTITRTITPGEKEIIRRLFDGIPASKLKTAVQKAAQDPEMRELIELSDFASFLNPDDAA